MARPKKAQAEAPKAEATPEAVEAEKAPEAPETPKASNVPSEEKNALETRVKTLETIVANLGKRIAELERVTAYRKPVTSADILGL
jgi:uncharacterized protein YceH (UPF0502 family)